MSPYLFSADHAAVDLGAERATVLVSDLQPMSISDVFADYAAARARRDKAAIARIRLAAGPDLLAELDSFDAYPATA
ncbi:hypothetical protein TUSST3_09030 [Streptomyces sp. TUS-ST3]|uniref:hypothetical protein n=1 Tax=Streptomyces sp. TUS-ST3 TaxID=3025591 RepID=UPI0024E05980|nr:hypothetical protein [Streptomyces sp. TUS-ST3]GLP64283.1 hypothetical protein TUSST3_09030 [Streptomyces sp. TUS-ST3]